MPSPWGKFSLPADAPAFALGESADFVRAVREVFGPLVERVREFPEGPIAWILAEVPSQGALSPFFRALEASLGNGGSLWVSFPKKAYANELAFPYTWSDVQKAGLGAGLVDNKIAAFSSKLTSIRFVIPLARRAGRPASPPGSDARGR